MTRRRYRKHLQAAYDLGYRHGLGDAEWWRTPDCDDLWLSVAYDYGRRDAELMRAEGFA